MWRWLRVGLLIVTLAAPAVASQGAAPPLAAAIAAQRASDYPTAARLFREAASVPSPIPEYALYLQADALSRMGDGAAAEVAAQAVEQAGDGPLLGPALLLAAREAARAGETGPAIAFYRRFLDRFPEHWESAGARFGLAEALEATGQTEEALRLFRSVWLTAPLSFAAPAARDRERALADRGVPAPPVTARQRVDRAERLLAGGQATQARQEMEALIGEGVSGDPLLRALRVVSEGYRRTGKPDDALRTVDRAIAVAPGERRATWLLERARLQQPRGAATALVTLDRLVRDHPRSSEASDALFLRAQLLESLNQPVEAEATYTRLVIEYPDDDDAGRGLWRLGWLAWFRRDYDVAAARWARLANLPGGQAYRENATYWIGRAYEERGDVDGATRQWAEAVSHQPRGYFGILATTRLTRRGLGLPPPREPRAPLALPDDVLTVLRDEPRVSKAETLRGLGLGAWADAELEDVARRSAGEAPRLYAVSAAFAQDARHHQALRILRRDFVPYARAGYAWLPRAFWEMFYPLGWRAEVASAARRAGIDPYLVSAVVREESSYNPLARSRVGARGLMQLMPDTARPMARVRGLAFQDGELLDDPAANIELGSAYLGGLVRDFGDARLAVAAYNAGPTRVREWWSTRKSDDLEVWVEQIPYNETRNFVRRVMIGWEEYRRLYASEAR
ncbi:MAG TPA: transglycosylase SLT domain-containing protein [Methylomirabilota bacterium]|nr:transglycosylase SLT domain-containing protein [Methylomirabilota bacterium]